MISANSRYANSPLVALTYEGNDVSVIVPSQQGTYSFNFIWYELTAFDRVDTLAEAFFGDPTKWWSIADANPEVLDWSVLTVGQIIRIPVS